MCLGTSGLVLAKCPIAEEDSAIRHPFAAVFGCDSPSPLL